MRTSLILLSGIPGSGKSSYGQWLQSEKGFLHFDVEKPGVLGRAGVEPEWNVLFKTGEVSPLIRALRRIGKPIVIDWGFPPRWLSVVAALKSAGVAIWWFDGDREAARASFMQRGTVSPAALTVQMAAIEKAWPQIQALFESQMIKTVSAGPPIPFGRRDFRTDVRISTTETS